MASPTIPTVALPTPTELDDTDDDDDDIISSALTAQPVPTSPPAQPQEPPPATVAPAPVPATIIVPEPLAPTSAVPDPVPSNEATSSPRNQSASPTALADTLPSGATNSTTPLDASPGGSKGLSAGAAAGIGVGTALAVILLVFLGWFFIRQRKQRSRRSRTSSGGSTLRGSTPDEEIARKSEVYAYRAGDAAEMSSSKEMGNDDRRRSELASPAIPVEAVGDREFAIELQGSDVPARSGKGGERLFDDAPIDERDVPDVPEPRFTNKKG